MKTPLNILAVLATAEHFRLERWNPHSWRLQLPCGFNHQELHSHGATGPSRHKQPAMMRSIQSTSPLRGSYFRLGMQILLFALLLGQFPAWAAVEIHLSVKFILNADGTHPAGSFPGGIAVGTEESFNTEIEHGNRVLDATGRAFSLKVVEYLDIQPPAVTGASVTRTCGTTVNNGTVTCTNTAGLASGMRVTGTGIPANTVIEGVAANTSFTMTANATATNTAVSVTASYENSYWFTLPARANRATFEAAATANAPAKTTWRWHETAINIYVNGSGSGQCAFVGNGFSIALGERIFNRGTVLHEIGHYFNLRHTHNGDYPTNPNPPTEMPPRAFNGDDLANGDDLTQTPNDNPNITTRDQLSVALHSVPYFQPPAPPNAPFADAGQRAAVDRTFSNVMSYHEEDVLISEQMDIWTQHANIERLPFCNGKTWFVANGGNNGALGNTALVPLETLVEAINRRTTNNDVLLLRSGNYLAPAGGTLSAPCTFGATRGVVQIVRP